jgi:hypothetical protein
MSSKLWHYCDGAWIPGERIECDLEHPVKLQQTAEAVAKARKIEGR